MKPLVLILFGLVALAAGNAQSSPPEGKARIIVWADFIGPYFGTTSVILDESTPFEYPAGAKNLVLDVNPGRLYLTYVHRDGTRETSALAALYLAAGQTAYLTYNGYGLYLETQILFEGSAAAKRPILSNPSIGGSL